MFFRFYLEQINLMLCFFEGLLVLVLDLNVVFDLTLNLLVFFGEGTF